jgi:hypothetical protein
MLYVPVLLSTFSCVLALSAQALAGPAARPLAIEHATVIDPEGAPSRSDMTVIVTGNRITAVEPTTRTHVPSGARRIDATGKFLIPGLWDMHVHPARETDLALLIANGVTGARIMGGEPRHLAWRKRINRGTLLGPRLIIAGPILEGPPPAELAAVIATNEKEMVRTPQEATAQVRAQKTAGYDFIKVYNNLSRDCYNAVVAEAQRQRMPVAGHVPFAVGLLGVLKAGQLSVEHLRGYVEELVPPDAAQRPGADLRSRSLAWRYADASKMAALARATHQASLWNCPTLAARINTRPHADAERYLAMPEAVYISEDGRAELRSRPGPYSNFTEQDLRLAPQWEALQDAMIRALRDAGAGLLAGTDQEPWGFSLLWELENLVRAGLTPREALAAATTNPVALLNAEDSLGSIKCGKLADLVLVDGDPLANIRNVQSVVEVVVNGRLIDGSARQKLFEAARREVNKP